MENGTMKWLLGFLGGVVLTLSIAYATSWAGFFKDAPTRMEVERKIAASQATMQQISDTRSLVVDKKLERIEAKLDKLIEAN